MCCAFFILFAKVGHVQTGYHVHHNKDDCAVPHTIGNGYACVLGCKANGKWVGDSRCKANAGSHQNKTDGGKLGPVHCGTKHCQKWIKYQQLLLKSKHSGKYHHHQSDCPNGNKALGVQLLDDKSHKRLKSATLLKHFKCATKHQKQSNDGNFVNVDGSREGLVGVAPN